MTALGTFGIIRRSRKQHEERLPIDPRHFDRIPDDVARRLIFERGYGEPFGVSDDMIARRFGGLASRRELLSDCDGIVLPKPTPEDLHELHRGALLWGWPHCVHQQEITEIAVERRQTLIAFEGMHRWAAGNVRDMHLFYRNNEMAGYCGVLHAFDIYGIDGHFGSTRNAVVLSLGSVSRGAIRALLGRGIIDITVYTQRPPLVVRDRVHECRYGQMVCGDGGRATVIDPDGTSRPLADVLAATDVIVNGILQDTDRPLMFLRAGEEDRLRDGALIIDVSCDLGMGFPFARPTSFDNPTFPVARATYYAVDHTPTYLWRSATWEISQVVIAYLERVLGGPDSWAQDETLRRAIDIQDGEIRNPKILSFRQKDPAPRRAS